jgi:predicted DNA-binding protein
MSKKERKWAKNDKMVAVYINESMHYHLDLLARRESRSLSSQIKHMILHYFEEETEFSSKGTITIAPDSVSLD